MMELVPGVEVLCPYPALYLREHSALVLADTHLGYEAMLAERGVFIPRTQLRKQVEALQELSELADAEMLVVNGDLKHEFGGLSYTEMSEVVEFLSAAGKLFGRVCIVRGNHDNFVAGTLARYGAELVEELALGRFLLFHGHRMPVRGAEVMILAHEHPALALYDEVGAKEKLRCFLHGEAAGAYVVVMPAFSPLATGSEVNQIPREELLSPFLRSIEVDSLKVLAVSREAGCLEFATLGEMRRFA
ncbi:MAG: metallophosphoesterase [Euryarchaeota archaeon]|nr:metallophosphoesterase [Euryarchaeota archaeon]